MLSFSPQGAIATFTAATTAPTSVNVGTTSKTRGSHVCLTNADATNDATVGWGQTDAEAKANAAATTSPKQFYVVHGSQVVIAAPGGDQFYTGITASSTAAIKVQAGIMD